MSSSITANNTDKEKEHKKFNTHKQMTEQEEDEFVKKIGMRIINGISTEMAKERGDMYLPAAVYCRLLVSVTICLIDAYFRSVPELDERDRKDFIDYYCRNVEKLMTSLEAQDKAIREEEEAEEEAKKTTVAETVKDSR